MWGTGWGKVRAPGAPYLFGVLATLPFELPGKGVDSQAPQAHCPDGRTMGVRTPQGSAGLMWVWLAVCVAGTPQMWVSVSVSVCGLPVTVSLGLGVR